MQAARVAGFNVTYGDGSRASVIKAFGVEDVRAFVVVYTARRRSVAAVENLRAAFPDTPIWARALDLRCRNSLLITPDSSCGPRQHRVLVPLISLTACSKLGLSSAQQFLHRCSLLPLTPQLRTMHTCGGADFVATGHLLR